MFVPGRVCCKCGPCEKNYAFQFKDNCSADLSGYTTSVCATSAGFLSQSGYIVEQTGNGGAYTQSIVTPALDGLCISVCAQIYRAQGKSGGVTGICLGGVGLLFGRWANAGAPSKYGAWNKALAAGCVDSSGDFAQFGGAGNFADADILSLVLRDISGGDGTYDLDCLINGTILQTYPAQPYALTPGSGIAAGLFSTNGGQWDCIKIHTS